MGKGEILDGLYLTMDENKFPTGFVRYVDGKKVWMFGCRDRPAKLTKFEQPKIEEIKMTATVEGVKPLWSVKADSFGYGYGLLNGGDKPSTKKKWGVWDHEASNRDNLALLERGHGLVGFTVDGQPACVFFGADGVFNVSTRFMGMSSLSVKDLTETLDGRVGEFNGLWN